MAVARPPSEFPTHPEVMVTFDLGSFARLGVWSGDGQIPDLHQPTFHLDERALLTGVRVLTHTALAALA